MRNRGPIKFIAALLALVSLSQIAEASPPACSRDVVSLFNQSDAIVEATVTKSRRWTAGVMTIHLVAKYKIIDVFKGDFKKDDILIVTDTCLDTPIPENQLGYPVVETYCRGGIGFSLPGVDSLNGAALTISDDVPHLILYLIENVRMGAPQLTWLETPRTSFHGGCRQTDESIPKDERHNYFRLNGVKETG
jgi:hypothetical protein